MPLKLFSFFHLNLNYSAIEISDRPKVIKKCYWPLLNLIDNLNLKFGIELTGHTLEMINDLDPLWIEEFKKLISSKKCELIASGYAQIIGPLVPAKINQKNLQLGNDTYKKILGIVPKIAMVNEQTFSESLVDIYKYSGFTSLIIEWDNSFRNNPEWNKEISYLPQKARGTNSSEINLVWNKSIEFQKFQRYAHGEIELDEILKFIRHNQSKKLRALPVYGNDAEIFDFRPGRYMSETLINNEGEWNRVYKLFNELKKDNNMQFILPSDVTTLKNEPLANQSLSITSAAHPIAVKKQNKYNIVRWSVSGRNDFKINTDCWKIFNFLETEKNENSSDWKELCYLWSSDFRTHITEDRWNSYLNRMDKFLSLLPKKEKKYHNKKFKLNNHIKLERKGRFLIVNNDKYEIKFNCLKGLSVESCAFNTNKNKAIFGTIEHGYFDDIGYGADFFSGHLVYEEPGKHKVTDLKSVEPKINTFEEGVEIECEIETIQGIVNKKWTINNEKNTISLSYELNWPQVSKGSFRLGYITLLPNIFDKKSLYYRTCNGGKEPEKFEIPEGISFNHGETVSTLISANQALGATNGIVEIGDKNKKIIIKFDKSDSALISLVSHVKIGKLYFTRLCLSLREIDDTAHQLPIGSININIDIEII
tara:strand:- start:669 stop:2615 length:1947 start_codon:yes stop_codon:yes gene_type:complete